MARRKRRSASDARNLLLDLDYAANIEKHIQQETVEEFSVTILEAAVNALELPPSNPDLTDDLFLSDTKAKLKKNDLGEPTLKLIREVINHSSIVEEFIKNRAKDTNDPDFARKLRSFFFNEYKKLFRGKALFGDGLFSGVRDAVAAMIPDPKLKCAALSILVHLFLVCDLFERPNDNVATE